MNKLLIYIMTHKDFIAPKLDCYTPLFVGKETSINNDKNKYNGDNTGNNISSKNGYYCELTGLYWIWKNSINEIVGLCHYRRYFFKKILDNRKSVLDDNEIRDILKKYDIILPKKMYFHKKNNYDQFCLGHDYKVLDLCREIISELYPNDICYYDEVMESNSLYCYNMFISKKELIDDYCKWSFDIYFELEKRLIEQDNYYNNPRIIGFVSERLFNVWIKSRKLKIKETYVYNTEEDTFDILKYEIRNSLKKHIG